MFYHYFISVFIVQERSFKVAFEMLSSFTGSRTRPLGGLSAFHKAFVSKIFTQLHPAPMDLSWIRKAAKYMSYCFRLCLARLEKNQIQEKNW